MDEGLYTHISADGVIISPEPIDADIKASLEDSYKVLAFQMLCEKPMLCVCVGSTYPVLYPGTVIVPESDWGHFESVDPAILMNEFFIESCLGVSGAAASFTDLLGVFEMLTDAEKLVEFGDEHGLIIGGVECSISQESEAS